MEAEGRPAKMRKLEHAQETEDATMDESTPAIGKGEAQTDSAPVTNSPENSGNVEGSVPQEVDDAAGQAEPKLSKNQLKKQRRWERWEAGREDRKVKRKEKIKARKERRRTEWEGQQPGGSTEQPPPFRAPRRGEPPGVQVPITILFDCDFEEYMHDHELKSLGLQITRSYSDNRKAPFRCHLGISSWGGKMKERFDGVLAKQYTSWKGFEFCEEDFVTASEMSKERMNGPRGGRIAGALAKYQVKQAQVEGEGGGEGGGEGEGEGEEAEKAPADADADEEGEVVYLSAESDNTLERLKPNSIYIIGGLVDKNRHKGLCYKRALDRGIKTAKLPIGEFLQMDSRKVLVTNHVLDIMLKWLEHDDWGKAFIEVLPKRKGGVLKTEEENGAEGGQDGEGEAVEGEAGENVQPIPNSPPPAYEDVV
ncbi:hypothetical protein PMIN04_004088 [Paraphaeosphaeria minitans]